MRVNNVKFYRARLGMSLRELSVRADVSTATLVSIEKYMDYPGDTVRQRISHALGVAEEAVWPAMAEAEVPND